MIILTQTKKLNIVVDEKDVKSGNMIFKIMFQNRIYDSHFRCISHPSAQPLYSYLRDEYNGALDAAKSKFTEMQALFSSTPQPAPQPEPVGIGSKLEELLVKTIAQSSVDEIIKEAKPMLDKHIIETFGVLPQKHEVVTPKAKYEFEGVTHECFDKVLNLVNLDIPVFLSGAAGTGKNVICKQVAEALRLNFYFTNAVTQEYQLKGFIDANGTYHETQFYKAFTEGGLFFLDEMDASIPETLIILNSAIANRYFDFPTGKVEAHPDFRIISAGNTVGTGADIEYTGRFQLDASSLDRFALITVNYSETIEKAVTGENKALCDFAHAFRKVTTDCGIKCLFTYRAMERIAKLEEVFDLAEVLQMSLTKGLGKDDIKIITSKLDVNNKYSDALKKLA